MVSAGICFCGMSMHPMSSQHTTYDPSSSVKTSWSLTNTFLWLAENIGYMYVFVDHLLS